MRAKSLLRPNPAYIWRPRQIARRLAPRRGVECVVNLPWGAAIAVDTSESIGAGIARMGIHELSVSEAIWRLVNQSDLCLDVGANLGYFTSLLAHRSRRVISFEPHPRLLAQLQRNVSRWPTTIEIHGRAVSSKAGTATLGEPANFSRNTGVAGIGVEGPRTFQVEVETIDEVVGTEAVGLMKIDVEGHELPALEGAAKALANRQIRDLVFEEHEALPSPVTSLLTSYGFELFSLRQRLDRVVLAPAVSRPRRRGEDAPTYLASLDPDRVRNRLCGIGWRCLRG
jgi:FkbM family methyltransferase